MRITYQVWPYQVWPGVQFVINVSSFSSSRELKYRFSFRKLQIFFYSFLFANYSKPLEILFRKAGTNYIKSKTTNILGPSQSQTIRTKNTCIPSYVMGKKKKKRQTSSDPVSRKKICTKKLFTHVYRGT